MPDDVDDDLEALLLLELECDFDWPFRWQEQPAWNMRGSRPEAWITQEFKGVGLHEGIDLGLPVGTPIYASADGVVVDVQFGWGGGWGTHIVTSHDGDLQIRNAHLSAAFVEIGDVIRRGHLIGLSGNTGSSTGPHTHSETRHGFRRGGARGTPVNPRTIFCTAHKPRPQPDPPSEEFTMTPEDAEQIQKWIRESEARLTEQIAYGYRQGIFTDEGTGKIYVAGMQAGEPKHHIEDPALVPVVLAGGAQIVEGNQAAAMAGRPDGPPITGAR